MTACHCLQTYLLVLRSGGHACLRTPSSNSYVLKTCFAAEMRSMIVRGGSYSWSKKFMMILLAIHTPRP